MRAPRIVVLLATLSISVCSDGPGGGPCVELKDFVDDCCLECGSEDDYCTLDVLALENRECQDELDEIAEEDGVCRCQGTPR